MLSTIRRFGVDRRGSTAVEYSLMVALVTTAATAALSTLGGTLTGLIGEITETVNAIVAAVPGIG